MPVVTPFVRLTVTSPTVEPVVKIIVQLLVEFKGPAVKVLVFPLIILAPVTFAEKVCAGTEYHGVNVKV